MTNIDWSDPAINVKNIPAIRSKPRASDPIDKVVSKVVGKQINKLDPRLLRWVGDRSKQNLPTNPDTSPEAAQALKEFFK